MSLAAPPRTATPPVRLRIMASLMALESGKTVDFTWLRDPIGLSDGNLVTFGQNCCTPLSPHCSTCPLNDLCPRRAAASRVRVERRVTRPVAT